MERAQGGSCAFLPTVTLAQPFNLCAETYFNSQFFREKDFINWTVLYFWAQDYIRLRIEKLNIVTWMHTVVDKGIRGLVGGQMGQIGMRTEMPPPRQLRNGIPATT